MKTRTIKDIEDLVSLGNFMQENKKAGQLTKEQSDKIEKLVLEYRIITPSIGDCLLTADFGILGSIIIREIKQLNEDEGFELSYNPGSYDYIYIQSNGTKRILWTDYSNTEPYNRQSGLYCDGASFEFLGKPVVEKPEYREFQSYHEYSQNISFGIWGYNYNDFYGGVRFGICIKSENLNHFIDEIRKIVNK